MSTQDNQTVQQPVVAAAGSDDDPTFPPYVGLALLSYGFRPFFLGAALFGGLAIPLWVGVFVGAMSMDALYPPREWHVHEMLFGFIPALIAGFLLTAIQNWTDRMPLRGMPLLVLFLVWLAGRLFIATGWLGLSIVTAIDGAFLVLLAAYVWREVLLGRVWDRAPIGVLVTLYAGTNIFFHLSALRGLPTDLPERLALSIMTMMLTVIGGRLTPTFTREYLEQQNETRLPVMFSLVDGVVIISVLVAVLSWVVQPERLWTGIFLIVAGAGSIIRLLRWRGWLTWREPLVLILSIGYGWVGLYLLALGGSILGIGFSQANAVHLLTSGAMGAMTLAVMTRASLGHTGRPRYADRVTVVIYLLVNVAAILRICVPSVDNPTVLTHVILGLSAFGWSGAYLLFALVYGPYLIRPSVDELQAA